MSEVPTPRTDPTEDHPPTRLLQARLRVDYPGQLGGPRSLHVVAELYERSGTNWARLTCRTGEAALEELLSGEYITQLLHDLDYYRSL